MLHKIRQRSGPRGAVGRSSFSASSLLALLTFVWFVAVSGTELPAYAQADPANLQSDTHTSTAADSSILRLVDDRYNRLHTLRAHYIEHYTGMGIDRTESGTVLLRKPGLMRWSYDQPAGKVFVLDGHYGWFYTPGDPQVSRTPAKQLDDLRSPLRFLLGHTQLAKELDDIHTIRSEAASTPTSYEITGVPKGMGSRVRLLTLSVSPTGVIDRMKLEETDGATTEFTFSDQQENIPTGAADFTFQVPEGMPVVNAQSPL